MVAMKTDMERGGRRHRDPGSLAALGVGVRVTASPP